MGRYNQFCYCFTCGREINSYGIANHRKAHKRRKEDCKIQYSSGDTYTYKFASPNKSAEKQS